MANYLTDIIRRAEKYGAKNNLGRLLSALEVGANMGTAGIAQMGGGLSYVPAAIMGGDKAGQAVKGSVERAFTYEPRTQGARNFFSKVGEYAAPVMQYGSQKVDQAADAAFAATGSPAVGAAVKTLPTALSVAADRIRIGKAAPDRMELTAYHGSPHDFDEFSLSKIGTGEGAQVYGHGLYFAESPAVATEYRKNLTSGLDRAKVLVDGKPVDRSALMDNVPDGRQGELMSEHRERYLRLIASDGIKEARRNFKELNADPDFPPARKEAFKWALDYAKGRDLSKDAGRLYTVDIPDESVAKFLDWDKPLSEQPQAVRDAIVKMAEDYSAKYPDEAQFMRAAINNDATGAVIYKRMTTNDAFGGVGEQKAATSEWLNRFGIPGIRYLDAGSRQGGKGTSNFVVFDDKLVKVLKKE